MAHTYTTNLIHSVFSTKNRERLIASRREEQLWAYIVGIGRDLGVKIVTWAGQTTTFAVRVTGDDGAGRRH